MPFSKNTLILLTSAPTGLGHLRVMDAIKDGAPASVQIQEVGLSSLKANKIHALGSRVSILKKLTEFYQTNKLAEKIVSAIYVSITEANNRQVKKEFENLDKKYPDKKNWVVVCTHFGIAYALASCKEYLQKKCKVKIFLVVVVTDDSPQRVWAVPQADIIFCPSEETAKQLRQYLPKHKNITAVTFPISPRLGQKLNLKELELLYSQLDPQNDINTQIQIPISGAAVQLKYFEKLIDNMNTKQFEFTVIGQKSIYTTTFFDKLKRTPRLQLSIGLTARETVNFYESLFFQPKRPALEITKPSEQIFKALLGPQTRGGVILLLTAPIGRQEKDNLQFLARYNLMPSPTDQQRLEYHLVKKEVIPMQDLDSWRTKASYWRAVSLPSNPVHASKFIKGLLGSGLFYAMLSCNVEKSTKMKPNGVEQIWKNIRKVI